jgi:hypothetical protein
VAFSAIGLNTADTPLFRRGEAAGGFTTRVWNRLHGVDVVIQPYQTVTDPDKRALFRDLRFRRALSIALDRDEMNAVFYFGRASPRQTTVIPSSVFYDPAEAARLLAELGLVDRDGDGLRELPDGRPFGMAPAPATPAPAPPGLPHRSPLHPHLPRWRRPRFPTPAHRPGPTPTADRPGLRRLTTPPRRALASLALDPGTAPARYPVRPASGIPRPAPEPPTPPLTPPCGHHPTAPHHLVLPPHAPRRLAEAL